MKAKPEGWHETRADRAGDDLELPQVPAPALYLMTLFSDLGWVHPTGFGMAPLPFSEIAACAPWTDHRERMAVRDMSKAFLAGTEIGEDQFGIPPWEG